MPGTFLSVTYCCIEKTKQSSIDSSGFDGEQSEKDTTAMALNVNKNRKIKLKEKEKGKEFHW